MSDLAGQQTADMHELKFTAGYNTEKNSKVLNFQDCQSVSFSRE